MKTYCCEKCGSIDVFIDDRGNQKALMCGGCGVWIKWVGKKELPSVERFIKDKKEDVWSKSTDVPLTLEELEDLVLSLRLLICQEFVQNKDKLQNLCDRLMMHVAVLKR